VPSEDAKMTFFSSADMGRGAGCGTPRESSVAAIGLSPVCNAFMRLPDIRDREAFLKA
jgi:hypothetical protein